VPSHNQHSSRKFRRRKVQEDFGKLDLLHGDYDHRLIQRGRYAIELYCIPCPGKARHSFPGFRPRRVPKLPGHEIVSREQMLAFWEMLESQTAKSFTSKFLDQISSAIASSLCQTTNARLSNAFHPKAQLTQFLSVDDIPSIKDEHWTSHNLSHEAPIHFFPGFTLFL